MKLYIKEQEHYRTDAIFFLIGLVLFFPLFAFGLWFGHTGYTRIGQMFACGFQRVTGFPCPGCGGTRAFYYLFRGEFFKSFLHHPAVLYGMGAYLEFMALYLYRNYIRKTNREIQIQYYLYGALFVIVLQWVVKLAFIVARLIHML